MANEFNVKDKSGPGTAAPPVQQSGKNDRQDVHGKAFQVNENSVENPTADRPKTPQDSSRKPSKDKLQGKAFQVNEDSVKPR